MMLRKLNVESWHSTGRQFSGLFPRDLSNLSVVEGLQPVAEIANAALQLSISHPEYQSEKYSISGIPSLSDQIVDLHIFN